MIIQVLRLNFHTNLSIESITIIQKSRRGILLTAGNVTVDRYIHCSNTDYIVTTALESTLNTNHTKVIILTYDICLILLTKTLLIVKFEDMLFLDVK